MPSLHEYTCPSLTPPPPPPLSAALGDGAWERLQAQRLVHTLVTLPPPPSSNRLLAAARWRLGAPAAPPPHAHFGHLPTPTSPPAQPHTACLQLPDGVWERLQRHRPMRNALLLILSLVLAANCVWAAQGVAEWRRGLIAGGGGSAAGLAGGGEQLVLQRLNSTTLSVEVSVLSGSRAAGGMLEMFAWVGQPEESGWVDGSWLCAGGSRQGAAGAGEALGGDVPADLLAACNS